MAHISFDQLPEWFSLSKYKATNELDLSGWLDNFLWRSDAVGKGYSESLSNLKELEKYLSHAETLVDGNSPYGGPSGLRTMGLYKESPASGLNRSCVWSIPVEMVVGWIVRTLSPGNLPPDPESEFYKRLAKISENYAIYLKDFGRYEELFDDDSINLLSQPFDDVDHRSSKDATSLKTIAVDLNASDKTILNDFAKWLEEARKYYSALKRKHITDSDMRDWSEYKVLQYLDLSLWAKLANIEISDAVMGRALFPEEYDVALAERIRKVVRHKAKTVISSSFVWAILSQIESSEQNS